MDGFCFVVLVMVITFTLILKWTTKHQSNHQSDVDLRDIVTFDLLTRDDVWEDDE